MPPQSLSRRSLRTPAHRPDAKRVPLRSKVSAVGTMVAVAAIFGVFALPAYALDSGSSSDTAAPGDTTAPTIAQEVSVEDDVVLATGTRDGYAATSYAEYREAAAAAAAAEALSRSTFSMAPAAPGDDYPFRGGYGLSALGYYMGQCTDFVAWRLNRDAGASGAPWVYTWARMTPNGGNADMWLSAWQSNGWPVSTTPIAGSVAWFPGMHVGYVREVYPDGSFMIEDYNRVATETYGQEIFQPGSIPYFLYPPG